MNKIHGIFGGNSHSDVPEGQPQGFASRWILDHGGVTERAGRLQ